mgnify:CR=1 FL=1
MKKAYKSKTILLAVATFLIGGFMALESNYPTMGWIVMGKAVLDALLRFITSEEVIV